MVDKITFAGTSHQSGAKAARALHKLAGLKISSMEVMRITQQIGTELLERREQDAALHQRRELPPSNPTPVEIACVEVDGGRMRTRAPEAGRGVHDHQWKETKVAALWKMEGKTFDCDPHPEPPRCFLDPVHVPKLVREIKRQRAEQHARDGEEAVNTGSEPVFDEQKNQQTPEREWPPKRVFRTCVATFKDVYGFGPLVAAEAQRRGFYDASRQVFLGDGDHKNWTVHKLHFPHFTAITDFVHSVTYIYEAALVVTNSAAAHWEQYVDWMRACWQGQINRVLCDLRTWQTRLGTAEQGLPDNDPRVILASVVTYLGNNQSRMNYPDYRTRGLPITSCLVESLIKEINHRVKGTEKFWNRLHGTEGEAILQTTASLVSDGEPLTKFILSRPGSPYYRRKSPGHATRLNKPD